jgi:hypothetical protein
VAADIASVPDSMTRAALLKRLYDTAAVFDITPRHVLDLVPYVGVVEELLRSTAT